MSRTRDILLLLLLLHSSAFAGSVPDGKPIRIDIRLFADTRLSSIMITALSGGWNHQGHPTEKMTLATNAYCLISVGDGKIRVKYPDQPPQMMTELLLKPENRHSVLRIRPIEPGGLGRKYGETIRIRVRDNELELIYQGTLEPYIAGVVASEAGAGWEMEFYKAQAVMCRTYALGHLLRHSGEGFQLCDGVHCQVFHGLSHNPDIDRATEKTHGLVIMDASSNELITAAFHSNCGGQTLPSADLWSPDPHLQVVDDPWCKKTDQAIWTQQIPLRKWTDYLIRNGIQLPDSLPSGYLDFAQPARKTFYRIGTDSIPLKKIRSDWSLRSTFFNLRCEGDQVILSGRGYGHGVGLCQEGAMEMAKKGKPFEQIIRFYFKRIKIQKYR
jgi:stage II sporulation protein D